MAAAKWIIPIALMAAGCVQDTQYVPVEIKREIAVAPPECRQKVPDDLPPVPPIEGKSADAARVNAHWAANDLHQRKAYRSTRDAFRVCQRYAQGVGRQ